MFLDIEIGLATGYVLVEFGNTDDKDVVQTTARLVRMFRDHREVFSVCREEGEGGTIGG